MHPVTPSDLFMSTTFDRCAFDYRFRKGQLAKDCLEAQVTSDELIDMQAFRATGRTTRCIPAFFANDAQLRAVLAQAVIGYCFRNGRIPSGISEDLKTLTEFALQEQADIESGHKVHGFVHLRLPGHDLDRRCGLSFCVECKLLACNRVGEWSRGHIDDEGYRLVHELFPLLILQHYANVLVFRLFLLRKRFGFHADGRGQWQTRGL